MIADAIRKKMNPDALPDWEFYRWARVIVGCRYLLGLLSEDAKDATPLLLSELARLEEKRGNFKDWEEKETWLGLLMLAKELGIDVEEGKIHEAL
jgi:hypothetical protein